MKVIHIIYFHIYNSYFKNGNYTNDIPHLTAFGLVGCSFSFIVVEIVGVINDLVSGSKLSEDLYILIMLLSLGLFFFMFLYKHKYQKIYEEIKDSKWDNLFYKILSFAVVISGFILFVAYCFKYGGK